MSNIKTITTQHITHSSYTDNGLDVGVRVEMVDGTIYDGEVTLLPLAHDGTRWGAWGSIHNWMGEDLFPACLDDDGDHDPRAAAEIEEAAAGAAGAKFNAWEAADRIKADLDAD